MGRATGSRRAHQWVSEAIVLEAGRVSGTAVMRPHGTAGVQGWPHSGVRALRVSEHRQGIHTGLGNSSLAGLLEPTLGGNPYGGGGNSSVGTSVT